MMRRLALATFSFLAVSNVAKASAPLAAQACLGCHGQNGAGAAGVPGLTGRSADELRTLMIAFRANERPGTIMGRIARGYSDAEIVAASQHFARGGQP